MTEHFCKNCGCVILNGSDLGWRLSYDEQHPELGQILRNEKDGSVRMFCRCFEGYWGL